MVTAYELANAFMRNKLVADGNFGRKEPVLGPAGRPITMADLPPPGTRRWVMRRKAEVVAGVRAGLLSLEEACERYTLSVEEFLSWQRLIDEYGLRGLRATRVQKYRKRRPGEAES